MNNWLSLLRFVSSGRPGQRGDGLHGAMGKAEPGIASPYDGTGDQAVTVGTALMIRTGEDLVTLVFSGVTDAPAQARRICDTARSRM